MTKGAVKPQASWLLYRQGLRHRPSPVTCPQGQVSLPERCYSTHLISNRPSPRVCIAGLQGGSFAASLYSAQAMGKRLLHTISAIIAYRAMVVVVVDHSRGRHPHVAWQDEACGLVALLRSLGIVWVLGGRRATWVGPFKDFSPSVGPPLHGHTPDTVRTPACMPL